jgi:hypothetical protein
MNGQGKPSLGPLAGIWTLLGGAVGALEKEGFLNFLGYPLFISKEKAG